MMRETDSSCGTTEPSSGPRPPRTLLLGRMGLVEVLLAGLGFVAVVMSALAIPRVGIGWDSGIDTLAALEVREIVPGSGLYEAYDQIFLTSEFYGVLVQWTADFVYQFFGGNGLLPTGSPITYQLQAAVNLLILVVSVGLVAVVVGFILNSRITGLFVWASVLSLPFVMGHSVVNFKDLPVASGLLVVSAGAALLWVASTPRVMAASGLLVALGTFIALGVRIGSWILVGFILTVSVALSLVTALRTRSRAVLLLRAAVPLAGVAVAVVGVVLLHPIARIDVARWAWDAYLVSRSYPWRGTIRTLGQDLLSTELPWWYVPVWFMAQAPVLVTILAALGASYWVIRAVRALIVAFRSRATDVDETTLAFIPFATQALVLPAGLIVIGATLYDGIRHVSFAVPALLVLAAPLVSTLFNAGRRSGKNSAWIPATVAVMLLAVPVTSLIASARWFPYMYAHVNVVAAAVDEDRDWEYDYWGTTVIEGANLLREYGVKEVVISPAIDPLGNFEVANGTFVGKIPDDVEYGLYVFRRWYASIPTQGCRRVFELSRAGVTLGEGAICQGPESLSQLKENVREPQSIVEAG